jgi:hypothetical protein
MTSVRLITGGRMQLLPGGAIHLVRQCRGQLAPDVQNISWWPDDRIQELIKRLGIGDIDAHLLSTFLSGRRTPPWASFFFTSSADLQTTLTSMSELLKLGGHQSSYAIENCGRSGWLMVGQEQVAEVRIGQELSNGESCVLLRRDVVDDVLAILGALAGLGVLIIRVKTLSGNEEEAYPKHDHFSMKCVMETLGVALPLETSKQWCGLHKPIGLGLVKIDPNRLECL